MSIYDNRMPIGSPKDAPPKQWSKNKYILEWWTKSHDTIIYEAIKKYEWLWQDYDILLQAMLSVNDMFMLGKDTVKSIFIEDVTNFFDEKDIINTPNVKIQGKSGFDYKIDFVIPKSKRKNLPERFILAINSPRETSIKSALFTWDDIKNNRSDKENNLLVFLNDQKRFDKKIIDALATYNAKPILWSQRNKFIDDLAV